MERVSIELTNRCKKACAFCYNASTPGGDTAWDTRELVAFVEDLAANGVRAVSFGGGEPLEYEGVFDVLHELRGVLFRSMTTNGLLLDDATVERLVDARPDKVHVSIHFPDRAREVDRVAEQVVALAARGVRSGVNLLVHRAQLEAAKRAAMTLHARGIGNDRIVYLPVRGSVADTPSPEEIAHVAGAPFQSMTCLAACGKSERFCSVSWDKTVAWCSYTRSRARLAEPTYAALERALNPLDLTFCGDDHAPVRLSRRPQHGHDVVRDRP